MRNLIQIIQEAQSESHRLDRSAFIYLDPTGEKSTFAQCGSCTFFMPGKERCSLYGKEDRVVADASCGVYVQGKPHDDQKFLNKFTPKNSGYVLGQVRCENCGWFEDGVCHLFRKLNQHMADVWDLDEKVKPQGCCNAWQKKS